MATKKMHKDGRDLKETANKVWLAGLGALATAGEEGGKLFDKLAARGEDFEADSKEQVERLKDQVEKAADRAKSKASGAWSRFESLLDDKVTAALHRVGVPTRDEIKHLSARVADLSRKIEQVKPKAKAKARTTARAHKAQA
jgi:poly(hydroxyalkanoate) granule-associated protein